MDREAKTLSFWTLTVGVPVAADVLDESWSRSPGGARGKYVFFSPRDALQRRLDVDRRRVVVALPPPLLLRLVQEARESAKRRPRTSEILISQLCIWYTRGKDKGRGSLELVV